MQHFINALSNIETLYWFIIGGNIVLLLFAHPLLNYFFHEEGDSRSFKLKVLTFRLMNLLMIALVVFYATYAQDPDKPFVFKLLSIIITLYLSYLSIHIVNYFIVHRYGIKRKVNKEQRLSETYTSRLFGLVAAVFIGVIALISIIRILELDSLLEAGGVIGFIGVFLALTQSTWAPDIFSGLIILNSNILKEGDVIEFTDGQPIYGLVYKTKMFHTEVLNLVDNHRIMIRNARLRDFTINNLSRFASAKGLREKLVFKVGYDVPSKQVKQLFALAFDKAQAGKFDIEAQHGIDSGVLDTGDHAVEWVVFYYTKSIDKLPKVRQQMMEVFYDASVEMGVSLSTPMTHVVDQPVFSTK